jgi:hypothetical protein
MNIEVKIKDEELLLLALCRLNFSAEYIDNIKTLTAAVSDWKYFSSLANAHGIAALVYHNLEKHQLLVEIPHEVVTFLRGTLMRSLSRNIFNSEMMNEVLRLFNSEDIRTILLKGFALENTIYGKEGLRQMTDVDILLSIEQCIKAREILINHGFTSMPVKSILHKLIPLHIGKHLPSLIKNGFIVEIHHELFGGRNDDLTKSLFESSSEIIIKGEKAWIPPPQMFFLYLIRHLWFHEMNNESQLRLYTDLAVLLENFRNDILNNNLLIYAVQLNITEILACRLGLLRDFFDISFPEWINDFIDKCYNEESINRFIFFLKSPKGNPPFDKALSYRNIISDIPGIHRKFLFILGDIFPTISFMKKRYDCKRTWQVFLYYPQRAGKIMWLFKR